MRIHFAAAELAPLVQSGGLGDAVSGLARALAARGHAITCILPAYRSVLDSADCPELQEAGTVQISLPDRVLGGRWLEGSLGPNLRLRLLDLPELYDRAGLYGEYGFDYPDNPLRYIAFARAAAYLCDAEAPDALLAHDWHAAPDHRDAADRAPGGCGSVGRHRAGRPQQRLPGTLPRRALRADGPAARPLPSGRRRGLGLAVPAEGRPDVRRPDRRRVARVRARDPASAGRRGTRGCLHLPRPSALGHRQRHRHRALRPGDRRRAARELLLRQAPRPGALSQGPDRGARAGAGASRATLRGDRTLRIPEGLGRAGGCGRRPGGRRRLAGAPRQRRSVHRRTHRRSGGAPSGQGRTAHGLRRRSGPASLCRRGRRAHHRRASSRAVWCS